MVFPALKTFFCHHVYVVVQFYPWFNFHFSLFYVIIPKNKGKNIKPRTKLNHNMYILFSNNNSSIRLT